MVLSQDDFVKAEHLIPRVKDRTDWEHPDSINWTSWQKAIHSNSPENDYLILEGLFMFHTSAQPVQADFNYYLSIDELKFLEGRKKETRWGIEPLWFIKHVWHSHFKYGLPSSDSIITQFHDISEEVNPEVLTQITS